MLERWRSSINNAIAPANASSGQSCANRQPSIAAIIAASAAGNAIAAVIDASETG